MNNPTVFISYSHDSEEHDYRVLALANRLREEGIDSILDQYETSPPEGWPKWMDRHIAQSNYVIVICTGTYYRRVMGEDKPGTGQGVKWESTLTYQHLYYADAGNIRFIPVLFKGGRVSHIPTPLQGATHYRVDTEQGYVNLYRRLTNQPRTIKPKLGRLKTLPPRERKTDFLTAEIKGPEKISLAKLPSTSPDLFGREKKLALLDAAWQKSQTNVVSLVAWGGVGKTALVKKWLLQMGTDHYRGAERVFGWSFYSQGAAEGRQVSADPFIAAALEWFGDDDPTKGSPWDKGERLAELVKQQRTLLILDGLEPLQNPPPVEAGRIKDPGLCCLLRELANQNRGLCIVTTRLEVDDLKDFVGTSLDSINLENLSDKAGAEYLTHLGVEGTPEELKQAAREFGGHALALTLLGRYLKVAYQGDIRQRDKIARLTMEPEQGGHARRVMESHEKWFQDEPELNILRLMGLFDHPAEGGAIEVLKAKPAIKGLTSELQGLSHEDWQFAVNDLREAGLLAGENPHQPDILDCHPLVREHFGEKLQVSNPEAWKEAHSRLYEHYKSQAKELPDTLEEMMPLFTAVAHGCQAGRHQEALTEIYDKRIQRGGKMNFCMTQLGAIGADLASLSGFFDPPWHRPAAGLRDASKAAVLNWAGFRLQALGRLAEAVQPTQSSLKIAIAEENWARAAVALGILCDIYVTTGDLSKAEVFIRQGVDLADSSGDAFQRVINRAYLAGVLHKAGRLTESEMTFKEAEEMQKEREPETPLLYSLHGFQFCDLLISRGKYYEAISQANKSITIARQYRWLRDIALDDLSLGRAYIIEAQQAGTYDYTKAKYHLNQAVDGLRQAGTQHHLPRGLLARAALRRVMDDMTGAQKDLDEAMTIATWGGMRLHEADGHLEYAQFYLARRRKGDRAKARESLAQAKGMITEMGYHRRDGKVEELDGLLQPADSSS